MSPCRPIILGDRRHDQHGAIIRRHPRPGQKAAQLGPAVSPVDARITALAATVSQLAATVRAMTPPQLRPRV